jgi:hypothetical protein
MCKLTLEVIKELEKHLRIGNYVVDVMGYLGIDESTYYNWQKRAKEVVKKIKKKEITKENITDRQRILIKFYKSVKKAEKEAVLRNVANIQGASKKNWQASAWFLERRNYKEWGRKDYLKQEIKGNIKTNNKTELSIIGVNIESPDTAKDIISDTANKA